MNAAAVEHQPRERAVTCVRCNQVKAWRHDRVCEDCAEVAKTQPPGSLFAVGRPTRQMRSDDQNARTERAAGRP